MLFTWLKKLNKTRSSSGASEAVPTTPESEVRHEPEPAPARPEAPTPPLVQELPREKIAARAYEIWVNNGRPAGTGLRDWLQAEAELRGELAQHAPERLPTQPR